MSVSGGFFVFLFFCFVAFLFFLLFLLFLSFFFPPPLAGGGGEGRGGVRCMEEALSYIIKRDREGGRRSTRRGGKGREVGDLRGDFLFFLARGGHGWWSMSGERRKGKKGKKEKWHS